MTMQAPASSTFTHLTSGEVAGLLKVYGPNVLPQAQRKNSSFFIKEVLREPMLILLVITSVVYLALGDTLEGIVLGSSVFMVFAISLYQRVRSERALEALKLLSSPRALVIRDGVEQKISASELVPGDLVSLSEGDRVPADGTILVSTNLICDESLLTGESAAVRKNLNEKVYSSTLVVGGRGFIRIQHTGAATEVGKIGKVLVEADPGELHLTLEIRSLTKIFAFSGLMVCAVIAVLYALNRGGWLDALLVGLATQLALLPEEFPVVLTVFMAIGAWRLSRVKVLVRKPEAIERLGAITTLCVDKTGTLTENQMKVVALNDGFECSVSIPATGPLPEKLNQILQVGVAATPVRPFDPMDKAFLRAIEQHGPSGIYAGWELVREYPLSPELLSMSHAWRNPARLNEHIVACKGAPEAVMALCRLTPKERESVLSSVHKMAGEGQRIIGVAKAKFEGPSLPDTQAEFSFEWIGLVGLLDPLRTEVPEAVKLCRTAGIRVIMITGDYPETARNIAIKAGWPIDSKVLTGEMTEKLSDEQFNHEIQNCNIFARMVPAHKLRIVKALKSLGETVGMTGDGVNDAPSLKWADVGIAMGARGTDVAREASDIVLLDDNFASIVAGVHRGRMIFMNIRKALAYIVSVHVPIAGLSVLPVLFGWPLILLPVHIVLLELIIDPACTLLFESQEAARNPLNDPPRSLATKLFSNLDFVRSVAQGTLILAITALLYWYDQSQGNSAGHSRTLAFGVLILSNFGLIIADLTQGRPSEIVKLAYSLTNVAIVVGLLLVVATIFYAPGVSHFLKLERPEAATSLMILGFAFVTSTIIGIWNWIRT